MARELPIRRPDLPALAPRPLPTEASAVKLEAALIEDDGGRTLSARGLRILESELRGVTVTGDGPGLSLRDVVFHNCDLSNVDGREGSLRRVAIHRSRLLGFSISRGSAEDLTVEDSVLSLAQFSFAGLRGVHFENVDLSEASFMEARMDGVTFVNCGLAGADFRGARCQRCRIRGSSLDGVLGVSSLSGTEMPWPDLLGSTAALAAALGISVEAD